MGPLWFSPPVYVKTKRPGIRNGVSHLKGAAEELMAWDTKGPEVDQGGPILRRRVRGQDVPHEVREAFEAAAREANVYLSPE
ncbi:DUF982 domain-containing protein [Mesorhizobium sp. M0960]|uniref:DUF982 domain-containing protein n=1 Tax=Mesorhizobium sp. M0960 TaxID=2957035 RepID=UPI0033375FFB